MGEKLILKVHLFSIILPNVKVIQLTYPYIFTKLYFLYITCRSKGWLTAWYFGSHHNRQIFYKTHHHDGQQANLLRIDRVFHEYEKK
jgi:hypothetical protein